MEIKKVFVAGCGSDGVRHCPGLRGGRTESDSL